MSTNKNDYLTVAKIVKPQGIRGELKVLTMTDTPQVLESFKQVYVGGNCYKLLKVRPQGGDTAFITLSQIADRNAAELLRNMTVEVKREDAPALPEDTFYIADVIGCAVEKEGGEPLGVVSEITPARTDIYEVALTNGGKLIFPAVKGVITSIDLNRRVVTLNPAKLGEVALSEK